MKSILIVLNEEYLAKGIALALIEYFQSIHTTKNPFEAIDIIRNEKIDILISDIEFKTINSDQYIEEVLKQSHKIKTIVFIDHASIKVENLSTSANIIIQQKPISLKNIIKIITSINENKKEEKGG